MSDNYFAHQELVKRTKVLATKTFKNSMRMFDRHVGLFYKKRTGGGLIDYTPIQINRKGMSDNWGVLICYFEFGNGVRNGPLPIHFEIETKTGTGKLTPDQIIWKDFCESFGIWFFENRDENKLIKDMVSKAASMGLVISEVNFGLRK